MATRLGVHHHKVGGVTVVAPTGVLDVAGYRELRDTLLKAAVEEPRAVVVDLVGLRIPESATVALFLAVAERLDQWPGVPLLLSAPSPDQRSLFARTGVFRFVPVHPSVAAAVAAVHDPPLRRIARRTLPNALTGAAVARRFVDEVCRRWGVLDETPVAIANELVENTLVHTYCGPSLRLELRRGLLTVAVYDDDPTRPRPDEPGRGLRMVDRLARTWGTNPTPSGGKVVWAVIRTSPPLS